MLKWGDLVGIAMLVVRMACSNGQGRRPDLVGECTQSDTRSFVPLPVHWSGSCSCHHWHLDWVSALN